jgi:hypothetical protein
MAVDEDTVDPDRPRALHVRHDVVTDVDDGRRLDAGLLERPLEDPRMRLLEADSGRRRDEVEVPHQVERVEQLRQVPHPVAHRADGEAALLECGERRIGVGKDVPVAGDHEQLGQAAVEGVRHRFQSEVGDGRSVDLDRAPIARLLVRLEALLHPPATVVVGTTQGRVELADLDVHAKFGEGDGVHRLPRWVRPHDRVTDVQEHGAQRPGLRVGHWRRKRSAADCVR